MHPIVPIMLIIPASEKTARIAPSANTIAIMVKNTHIAPSNTRRNACSTLLNLASIIVCVSV